ncbi:unnamed protein product [Amaranthus hypochondriacus]
MFDSNYNANNNNNLTYYDQYDNNEAQLLNFNSRMLDNDDLFLDTILLPYHPPPPPPPQPPSPTTSKKGLDKGMKKSGGSHSKGRKTGKKDRHSKIYTAQGPRDRRMRLSLQIARKFFDLQDMLGFDKASKTIEWLFNKSRAAIKDLSEKSCTSLIIPNYEKFDEKNEENKCEKIKSSKIKNGGKKEKIMSKLNEKRKEARARARERTKEKLKMMNKKLDLGKEKNPNEESIVQEKVLEDQMACVGIVEKFLGASSTSSMVNYNGQDNDLSLGFSMEYPRSESGRSNGGFMEGTLEYVHQVDQVGPNPNCGFMGRGFNQGY